MSGIQTKLIPDWHTLDVKGQCEGNSIEGRQHLSSSGLPKSSISLPHLYHHRGTVVISCFKYNEKYCQLKYA